jgi:hypothetical protein
VRIDFESSVRRDVEFGGRWQVGNSSAPRHGLSSEAQLCAFVFPQLVPSRSNDVLSTAKPQASNHGGDGDVGPVRIAKPLSHTP